MPKPYTPNDKWSQRAAAEGYRARSVYKLMELDERFRLLKSGMTVLDFGAAPGSWLQYAAKCVGPKGKLIGFDLQDIAPVEGNVKTFTADITDEELIESLLKKEEVTSADIVLSDIAPSTSGIKDVDQWRSIGLTQAVLKLAKKHLRSGGKAVLKVFRGADFDEFLGEVRKEWADVRIRKVEASRDRSKEVYVIATKE